MNRYLTVGLSMLTGALVGGAAIEALHAQAKAPVYQVTLQDVSDAAALNKEFVPMARETIRKNGGHLLAGSPPVVLEGPQVKGRVIVNRWDSMEQVKAWYNSPEYQKAREIGNKYAKFHILLVEGVPAQ